MAILVLDFDGVLCDSARETAVSAWRAAAAFWPDEIRGDEPPDDVIQRFVAVRPWLETGYQAIPMIRLVVEGVPEAEFQARFGALCAEVMERLGVSREELVRRFGAARDAWIARDEGDWLSRHRFYPGVLERLDAARQCHAVYIATTKQERFAAALLRGAGVAFPRESIHGLERGRSKEALLGELLSAPGNESRILHFVEDRFATLQRVEQVSDLAAVRLYYASWGYGTPADLERARANDRITVWQLEEFLCLHGR